GEPHAGQNRQQFCFWRSALLCGCRGQLPRGSSDRGNHGSVTTAGPYPTLTGLLEDLAAAALTPGGEMTTATDQGNRNATNSAGYPVPPIASTMYCFPSSM